MLRVVLYLLRGIARRNREEIVVYVKPAINYIETADEIARRIQNAERIIGAGRVRWVNPDCGFWMLKRSIADRKIAALVAGRNLYMGQK